MLEIDKSEVDFLVTDAMADEAQVLMDELLPALDAEIGDLASDIDRVCFVACGSPLCAAQTTQILMERTCSVPVMSMSAADFAADVPFFVSERTLVVAISDSGTTGEVVDAVEAAKAKGARTLAMVQRDGTPVGEAAEFTLVYRGGSIWTLHLITLYHLAGQIIRAHGGSDEIETILGQLPRVPELLRAPLRDVEDASRELGLSASRHRMIYTVAGGNLVPLGYKEGVITMLEFTRTHGAALNAAEFRHGPLEVVEAGVPYVVMVPTDSARETTLRTLRFIQRHTDEVFVFDAADHSGDLHPALAPIALFTSLEFFYYYLSIAKDHNPDDRRYYGGKAEY